VARSVLVQPKKPESEGESAKERGRGREDGTARRCSWLQRVHRVDSATDIENLRGALGLALRGKNLQVPCQGWIAPPQSERPTRRQGRPWAGLHANRNYQSDLVPFFDGHGPPQLTYGLHSIRLRSVEQEQTQS
jgi:hypothetical protein